MKVYRISKNSLILFLGATFFKLLLDFSYIKLVSPYFTYSGMVLNINYIKYLESTILSLVIIGLISNTKKTLYELFLKTFIFTAYLPVATYYALTDNYREWFYLWTLFCLIIIILGRVRFNNFRLKIKNLREGNFIIMFLSLAIVIISLILLISYFGFSLNFSFLDVYEIRAEHHLTKIPLGGYLINWSVKIFIPFLVLFFLYYKRNLSLVMLLIILDLYFFSATGHKSYLFILLAILILSFYLNVYEKVLLSCLISIVFLGFAFNLLFDDIVFSSLLVRRVLFVPAQLSFFYYDFFRDNYLFLSHSIFKYFIRYKYDIFPAQIIGDIYFGNPNTNANNGIVADAFMNFGFLGIVLWGILVAYLVKLAELIGNLGSKRILYPLFLLSFYNFVNTAFFTTFLTHGLFLIFLLSIFLKNKKLMST